MNKTGAHSPGFSHGVERSFWYGTNFPITLPGAILERNSTGIYPVVSGRADGEVAGGSRGVDSAPITGAGRAHEEDHHG
jgi:hypothetical protein